MDASGNGTGDGAGVNGGYLDVDHAPYRSKNSLDGFNAPNSSGAYVQEFRSYCYKDDLFCQNCLPLICDNKSGTIHGSYGEAPGTTKIVPFLRKFVPTF
jgi:hypothetical protein